MLSILIPSIPERLHQLKDIIETYERYIDFCGLNGMVEIIAIVDNKQRSVGTKSNNLLAIAEGDYVVRSDDDDRLTQFYFQSIYEACEKRVDVITYLQDARINDVRTTVHFGLKNENQEFQTNGITLRPAWHCCTWKREFLIENEVHFSNTNYGEDDTFQRLANEKAQTSCHINEVCHVYIHDSTKTAAFQ